MGILYSKVLCWSLGDAHRFGPWAPVHSPCRVIAQTLSLLRSGFHPTLCGPGPLLGLWLILEGQRICLASIPSQPQGRKSNFLSTLLNSSGWIAYQTDTRHINGEKDQIHYVCTDWGSIRIWEPLPTPRTYQTAKAHLQS